MSSLPRQLAMLCASTWPSQERLLGNLCEHDPVLGGLAVAEVCSGGKHLRAVLPLAALRVLARDEPSEAAASAALWFGLATEILHAGTLCHDDVMDGDSIRRGRVTAWQRYGVAQAVTLGDYLFYLANEAIHRADLGAEATALALRLVSRAARTLAEGQGLENQLFSRCALPTRAEVVNVARGKTGALFGAALALGGIAGGVERASLEPLYGLGLGFGLCYQICDDVLDLVGDKGRGERGRDLWEGKPSSVIALCAEELGEKARRDLVFHLYRPRDRKTRAEIDWLILMLGETRAIESAKELGLREAESILRQARCVAPGLVAVLHELLSPIATAAQLALPDTPLQAES